MQTLEAILSLLVFLLIVSVFVPIERAVDNSVYKMQIANDVWRVFWLRGDLQDFNKVKMNVDANEITKLTGLCIGFEEEDVTSCIPKEGIAQVRKTAIVDGKPEIITLMVGRP